MEDGVGRHGLRALATDHPAILAVKMRFPLGRLLTVFNFSKSPFSPMDTLLPGATSMAEVLASADVRWGGPEDIITGRTENIVLVHGEARP